MSHDWLKAQKWESSWWGNCANTYGEEMKQLLYANRMGLTAFHDRKSPFNFDLHGAGVIDIGGGPVSLLLKCCNRGKSKVIDPCLYPAWVYDRYRTTNIEYECMLGENLSETGYDEAWIYNVLQHVRDPALVIANARRAAKIIRLFEWINVGICDGHLHNLTEDNLNTWLEGIGKVEVFAGQNTCSGLAYYGIFIGLSDNAS